MWIYASINNKNKIIPLSIIDLCFEFHYCLSKIIYIYSNYDENKPPDIVLADIGKKKYQKCNIKTTDSMKETHCHMNCGVCYIENFSLPNYIINENKSLNQNYLYDVIFISQYGQKQQI